MDILYAAVDARLVSVGTCTGSGTDIITGTDINTGTDIAGGGPACL